MRKTCGTYLPLPIALDMLRCCHSCMRIHQDSMLDEPRHVRPPCRCPYGVCKRLCWLLCSCIFTTSARPQATACAISPLLLISCMLPASPRCPGYRGCVRALCSRAIFALAVQWCRAQVLQLQPSCIRYARALSSRMCVCDYIAVSLLRTVTSPALWDANCARAGVNSSVAVLQVVQAHATTAYIRSHAH
jgi:hypothetical protein